MKRFSQQHKSLLRTNATSLNQNEVVSDNTIVRETTNRSNILLGQISISGSVVLGSTSLTLTDSVDFLVELSSVVVTELTSSSDTPGNSGRMPGTDTSDFSVTSVGFLLEMSGSPSGHDTSKSFTLGDTNNINEFILIEDIVDSDVLIEEGVSEGNLISDGFSSVDLDFEDIVLLLSDVFHKVVLGVDNSSD